MTDTHEAVAHWFPTSVADRRPSAWWYWGRAVYVSRRGVLTRDTRSHQMLSPERKLRWNICERQIAVQAAPGWLRFPVGYAG